MRKFPWPINEKLKNEKKKFLSPQFYARNNANLAFCFLHRKIRKNWAFWDSTKNCTILDKTIDNTPVTLLPQKVYLFLSKYNCIINMVCEECSPRQWVNSRFQDRKGGRFQDRKGWKTQSIRRQETIISLTHVASAWHWGWEHKQKQGPLQRLYKLIFKVTEPIHFPFILVEQLQANP